MTSPIRWVDAETRSLRSTDYVRDVTWGGGVWGLPDYGLPVGSDVQEHTTEDRRDAISALDIPTSLPARFGDFPSTQSHQNAEPSPPFVRPGGPSAIHALRKMFKSMARNEQRGGH